MKKLLVCLLLFCVAGVALGQVQDSLSFAAPQHSAQRLTVEDIIITGNKLTKSAIILREMSVRKGQTILADSLPEILQINKQRIYNTTLFTDVLVSADTSTDNHLVFQVVVKERWYLIPEITFQLADRNFNVWWTEKNKDISRSIIGVSLTHKNFRGNREQIGVTAQIGYKKQFSVHYLKPYIDKKQKHGLGFEVGVSQNQELFYTTDSNKLQFVHIENHPIIQRSWASLIYTFRPAYATNHIFSVSYEHNKIADTVLQLNPDYYSDHSNRLDLIELNYRLEINKVNNWNYPIVGTKVVGNIFSEIGIKGLDFFNYATLEAGQYNHLFSKFYSAFIFRGKLSFPTNQAYVWRQAMGTKYEYVRGYEYYVIDGYQYGLLRSNFKFELCNFVLRKIPLRYLPAIPIKIYPKIFTDVGYVGNPTPGNSFLNNKMLYSIGAGIDLFTAYDFKIRVEYAINHLGQKGLFLHFNAE